MEQALLECKCQECRAGLQNPKTLWMSPQIDQIRHPGVALDMALQEALTKPRRGFLEELDRLFH